jgi:hypothetical protein
MCASTALSALSFQHSQMKPRFHRLLLLQRDRENYHHVCGIALKSQSGSHSLRFMRTSEHFWNPSCAKHAIAWRNCDNLIENSALNLWKFTQKFWIAKGRLL